jgi:hypothetical protein
MNAGTKTRPPRGALAVIAVGLFATVAAALLSTDKPLGAVALEWDVETPIANSKPVAIAGGGGMQISNAAIRAAEPNLSGYRLFRVAAVLKIDAGSAIGQGRLSCRTNVPRRTIPAQTPGSRASYPRSSSGEDLAKQEPVSDTVLVEFNSHGTELASVELGDAFSRFTTEPGLLVSWPSYHPATQVWQWGLPDGRPGEPLELGFASIWRTTVPPSARISCTIETAIGKATTRTAGKLVEA